MTATLTSPTGRLETRKKITLAAREAFLRLGINDVTMDDIARSLTMSKRTLYQIFSNKEDLLLACLKEKCEMDDCRFVEMYKTSEHVLDFLLKLFADHLKELGEIKAGFFADLIKYPKLIAFLNEHKRNEQKEAVAFLEKGVEQGFFRPDINFHIFYAQLSHTMDNAFTNEELFDYTRRELFLNIIIPYFRGCSTDIGIHEIDAFLLHLSEAK